MKNLGIAQAPPEILHGIYPELVEGLRMTLPERSCMHIEVKLFANLRKNLPPGSTGGKAQLTLENGTTIQAVIDQLKIPVELAQMVLVNGEQTREFDRQLSEGDTISIFPPVAGGVK